MNIAPINYNNCKQYSTTKKIKQVQATHFKKTSDCLSILGYYVRIFSTSMIYWTLASRNSIINYECKLTHENTENRLE